MERKDETTSEKQSRRDVRELWHVLTGVLSTLFINVEKYISNYDDVTYFQWSKSTKYNRNVIKKRRQMSQKRKINKNNLQWTIS